MPKFIDLTGQKFNRLTVISLDITKKGSYWIVKCDCGVVKSVQSQYLRNGRTRSCGCLLKELQGTQTITHGLTKTKEWRTWARIKTRCTNPNFHKYKDYGARGITICDRWIESFENFLQDMGKAPSESHSIGRIDNNGNYEPNNCRWETPVEQANNTRGNLYLQYRGVTKTFKEWQRELGFKYQLVHRRLAAGWTVDEAFERPPNNGNIPNIRLSIPHKVYTRSKKQYPKPSNT